MTAETMMFPLLVSPLCASGFRRLGIGIRCASASICFQIMWSSQQTKTPEGPSNRSDWAFCPPGTVNQHLLTPGPRQERTLNKQVCSPIRRFTPFPDYVIQTQIQLIESQVLMISSTRYMLELTDLLSLLKSFPCGILIRISIIHLKSSI